MSCLFTSKNPLPPPPFEFRDPAPLPKYWTVDIDSTPSIPENRTKSTSKPATRDPTPYCTNIESTSKSVAQDPTPYCTKIISTSTPLVTTVRRSALSTLTSVKGKTPRRRLSENNSLPTTSTRSLSHKALASGQMYNPYSHPNPHSSPFPFGVPVVPPSRKGTSRPEVIYFRKSNPDVLSRPYFPERLRGVLKGAVELGGQGRNKENRKPERRVRFTGFATR